MISRQLVALGAGLYLSLAALALALAIHIGWGRLKRRPFSLLLFGVAWLALPAGGAALAGMKYWPRVAAMFSTEISEPLDMPGGCAIFPLDNYWNTPVNGLPRHDSSASYLEVMSPDAPLHADFGKTSGIPYTVLRSPVQAADLAFGSHESDAGPYFIPEGAKVEAGSDRHVLVVDPGRCRLYELVDAKRTGPYRWEALAGAVWDLRSNALRQDGWTSADAAGLPILPGLLRYEEVAAGKIHHALRFTTRKTRQAYVWPARHQASYNPDVRLPAMGQRFRLRGDFDASGMSKEMQVIVRALKEYGLVLADNGAPWYVTGSPDARWTRDLRQEFGRIRGRDFEAVDVSGLMLDKDSAQTRR